MTVLSTDTAKNKDETTLSEFLDETRDKDGQVIGIVSRIPQKPVTTPKPGEGVYDPREPKPKPRKILTTSGLDDVAGSIARQRKTAEILAQRMKAAAPEAPKPKTGPKAGGGSGRVRRTADEHGLRR
jgi:hypothetical protein